MTLQEYFNENQSLLIATIAVLAGCLLIIAVIIITRRYILKKKPEKQELKAASEALIKSADKFTNKQMLSDTVLPEESKKEELLDLNDESIKNDESQNIEKKQDNDSKRSEQIEPSTNINENDLSNKPVENDNVNKAETLKSKGEDVNTATETLQQKSDVETSKKEQKSTYKPIINQTKSLKDDKRSDVKPKESTSETIESATENTEKLVKKNVEKEQKNDGEKFRPTRSKQSQNNEKPTNKYTGKWLVYTENGKYAANLVASNGEVLLRSESYTALSGIKSGIETIKNNIAKNNFAISVDKNGNFFFKLYSSSTRLLCISEGYSTKAVCESAIESVKRFSQTAVLEIKKEENQ